MSGLAWWRSPTGADQFEHHDYADFAQEFLQRDRDYIDDYMQTACKSAADPHCRAEEMEGLAGRWGLGFPHCPRCQGQGTSGIVVAQDSACGGCRRNAA